MAGLTSVEMTSSVRACGWSWAVSGRAAASAIWPVCCCPGALAAGRAARTDDSRVSMLYYCFSFYAHLSALVFFIWRAGDQSVWRSWLADARGVRRASVQGYAG